MSTKRSKPEQIVKLFRQIKVEIAIKTWSLMSLQQRLLKTGGRLVSHARHYWLLLAESHLTRWLFGAMAGRIDGLLLPSE